MELDDVKHFFECMQMYQKHTKKTRFTVDILPEAVEEMIRVIDEAKTVEPKRGRWVKMTGMMPPEYHGHYECSECQWHMKGIRNSWTREEEMAYCPNCGARMEGSETDG